MCYLLFVLVLFVNFSYSGQFYNFNPHKVRFVDANLTYKNYLFRGCFPGKTNETGQYFDTAPLRETILSVGKQYNLSIPSDFYMIDIVLEDKYWNHREFDLEDKYWKENPEEGKMVYMDIVGGLVNASTVPKHERDILIKDFLKWDYDHLHSRIPDVYKMLHTPHEKPTVIYGHCSAGSDRTGEFYGAYYMQILGYDFPKTCEVNAGVKGHDIIWRFSDMVNWYCYYLELEKGSKDLNCDNWWWQGNKKRS